MPTLQQERWPADRGPRSAIARAWHGEIGLYRAAYGFGGVGIALLSLLGDAVSDMSTSAGGAAGWLVFAAVSLCELGFAWLCMVATWRARHGQGTGKRPGPIAVALALLFVALQFVLTAAWIGWVGLSGLGWVSGPAGLLLSG